MGVHGVPPNPQGLQAWDPERYGSLSIPSDDYSYDIFTKAATAVAHDRPQTGVDPLGGLEVQRLIATGGSQSAARLATYLNAVQPTARLFDAFQLLLYFGGGAPLEVGDAVMTVQATATDNPRSSRIAEGTHLLRDDQGIPVMVVNTECEALSCCGVRQPDTDRYRYWEVAGASHVSLQGIESSAPRLERDFRFVMPIDDDMMAGINRVSVAPVVDAALHHLDRWLREGTAPPVQPLIDFEGQPAVIVRDADGIARGGIRLPPVEVPVAHNSAIQKSPDVFARLVGSHEPFSAERLQELYPTPQDYFARVEKAARAAEADAVVLPRDVEPIVDEARAAWPL